MSAIKPEAYHPTLALGGGGSFAEWDQVPEFLPVVPKFEPPSGSALLYRATFGSVARVRSPVDGYVGSWVVTLGPVQVAGVDDKGNVWWPWSARILPKAIVRWGVGGAPFEAEIDWPLGGGVFAISGEFVEVVFAALSNTTQPANSYPGLKVSAAAAVSPGQRASKPDNGPWATYPADTFPVEPLGTPVFLPVSPVPAYARSVGISRQPPDASTATGQTGFLTQLDANLNVVRSDYYQGLTASDLTNAIFFRPVHPSTVWCQLQSENQFATETMALVYGCDLGAS